MKKQIILLLFVVAASLAKAQYSIKKQISKEERLNEAYCSSLFKTAHGTIFDLTDNINTVQGYNNILYWLQGRIAGLDVYTSATGVAIPFIRNQRATVYFDEIPVQFSFLNMINPADIALIKIIKGPFGGNLMYGNGGAIAIYSFKGEEEQD